MSALILRAALNGQPMTWLTWQEAALLYAKDAVVWTLGEQVLRFYGGVNRRSGRRSYLDIHPIVAARGAAYARTAASAPPLSNRELFRRDRNTCMYCLQVLPERLLTRDHVVPLSRGGRDRWTNVVTACRTCNQHKGDRLLSELGMSLHAVPFTPSHAEWMILRNRRILVDQMAFLQAQCPRGSRLLE